MAKQRGLARKVTLGQMSGGLRIDGRLPEGYVVLCADRPEQHSFLVRRLGPSVECPHCGSTAISAELMTDYYLGQAAAAE